MNSRKNQNSVEDDGAVSRDGLESWGKIRVKQLARHGAEEGCLNGVRLEKRGAREPQQTTLKPGEMAFRAFHKDSTCRLISEGGNFGNADF